jgi:YkoY family integral membrane protein
MIEVLLSIDNALVNASIAEPLPSHQRKSALIIGIIGGAILRFVALFFAAYIIQNKWILIIGGLYLIYLSVEHLFIKKDAGLDVHVSKKSFWPIIGQIIIADGIFSIDNIVSAVGISHNYNIVVAGVFIGIFSMLFITQIMSGIVHKHPPLKKAAYVIVGLIGFILILESVFDYHASELLKFVIIISVLSTAYIFSINLNKRNKIDNK